jgi:hypothetical protein
VSDDVSQTDVSRETVGGSVSEPNALVTGQLHLTNEAYHQGPGISKSHLDVAAVSPAHYWAAYVDPNRAPREATPAMVLGTAIHTAVLEPDLFLPQYVQEPDISRRSNAGKAEYADWVQANTGKTVLTDAQWKAALGVRDAVLRHPEARKLLASGAAEQSFLAVDEQYRELVKCRTDWLDWGALRIVDVKSTDDARPEQFIRSVLTYRYHVQQAWYEDVISQALGEEPPRTWVFLAVEKTPPYAIGLYTLPSALVQAGRAQARMDLARIVNCRMLGAWWDFASAGPVELALPAWLRKSLDRSTAETDLTGADE